MAVPVWHMVGVAIEVEGLLELVNNVDLAIKKM